ncbi:MAG TPA: sulfite exporter TauE/SafE family protein [Paracoccaceae bacterium]|nr:sulfite exporter TauE/SafE family protein [Paracoccaceae bacterium]
MGGDGLVVTGETAWLAFLFLLLALLYASVGQAGASGYLAAMGLFQLAPAAMKTTALSLNLLGAGIGTLQFWRSGLPAWRTFYPFGVLGIPFSLLGGAVQLPTHFYYPVVGAILLVSAAQMFRSARKRSAAHSSPPLHPPLVPALLTGAVIGFVSGTTGTGGGIFLAPVILSMNWVSVRRTAAVTAAYNLLNSAAALFGAYSILGSIPQALPLWLVAVGAGGAIGALIGSRHLPDGALRFILAVALLVAGVKLVLT